MSRTTRFARLCASLIVATAATAAFAACSASDSSESTSQLPPVVVQLADVDGTTVDVPAGGAVDLVGDDDVTAWTADIDDPSIVGFVPGREDGSATYNPGLEAKQAGETDVTLDNSDSGDSVTFSVVVTAE